MLIKISFILFVATFNVATSFEVHHHMTEDEMQDVFGTNDASDLPEYELVPVHHDTMSETNAEIRIQGRNNQHKLKLKSIDSVLFGTNTKVWRAVYDRKYRRVQYDQVHSAHWQIPVAYQDRHKRAALIMFTDEHNNTYYEGTIGSQYVIRPLPSSTLHYLSRNNHYQNHKNMSCQNSDDCTLHHVIFKRDVANNYQERDSLSFARNQKRGNKIQSQASGKVYGDLVYRQEMQDLDYWWDYQVPDKLKKSPASLEYFEDRTKEIYMRYKKRVEQSSTVTPMNPTSHSPIPKRNRPTNTQAPHDNRNDKKLVDGTLNLASQTVYPKILVVVDYSLFKLIGSDVMKTIKYVMTFMNAVDLRYKDLDDPAVELHVAGVIIAQEQHATPYVVFNGQNKQGVSFIEGDATLRNSSEYFNRTNYFNQQIANSMAFDVVTILTGYDLCQGTTGECADYVIGIAQPGHLCYNGNENEQRPGSSIVEDTGNYQGILTAVHELAHVFGVHHDGHHVGISSECSSKDGYLMQDVDIISDNHYFWSRCSKKAMRDFFRSEKGSCARDRPVTGATFSIDALPGKNLSLDEQCRSYYWHKYPEATACDSSYISKVSPQMRNRNVCNMIFCKRHEEDGCTPTTSAVHGTVCGDNKHCITGRCVSMTDAAPIQWT